MYLLFLSSLWPWLNFRESEDLVSGPVCRDCVLLLLFYTWRVTSWMSGAWLASRLDRGQNELIHDSKPSCFFLEPCTRLWTQEPAGVRMRGWCECESVPRSPGSD
ncbi:hypothetical protein JOQ06_010949 [Pogonophryne albipinna]|uniref:Uncharacterized protein n=1 Tax=Pogonophryne albipinna TaxID=1090488 RepID=A0AAD6FEW7_9TELE|nr:hypothetical protein JOQ06_010949 [Pogonophryne albipinna]